MTRPLRKSFSSIHVSVVIRYHPCYPNKKPWVILLYDDPIQRSIYEEISGKELRTGSLTRRVAYPISSVKEISRYIRPVLKI